VWILNIESGETLGFCKFEEGVQEIFAVEVLPGIRFPDLLSFGRLQFPWLVHSVSARNRWFAIPRHEHPGRLNQRPFIH